MTTSVEMFNESNNIESQSEPLEVVSKFPKNSDSNPSQEKAKNEIHLQTEKSVKNNVENSQEYLVKYQMKSFKFQNKNMEGKINNKRNWRAVSNCESPGLKPKKHLKNREIFRSNRRISIRLKGQASPLYFPLTRYKSKSRKLFINGLKTPLTIIPELVSDNKKKRGRPKRSDSNDNKPIDNDIILEHKIDTIILETPMTSNTENIVSDEANDMKIATIQVRKKRRIAMEKSPKTQMCQKPQNSLQTPDTETPGDTKPKSRPWNIPRNKLPSFTIVNNPLMLKSTEFYGKKSSTELKQLENTLNGPLYACRICGKHFSRKLSVRGHMKSHSKLFEYKRRTPLVSSLILPSPEITTDSGKEKQTGASLRILRKPKITRAGYSCDICGKVFYHKMGIRGHKKSHSMLFKVRRIENSESDESKSTERPANTVTLGHLLNTRSKAGIFDDIIFSNDAPTTYPIWKKEVRIGEEFQVTELPSTDSLIVDELPEDIIWSTEYTVPQVDEYLRLSNSPLVKFGGRNQEYALHILLRCQGNIWDALNIMIDGRNIHTEDDPISQYTFTGLSFWTEDERLDFKTAWIRYGKDFTQIQKYVISKSLRQVIEFYYRWTIECPDEYRKYSRTVSNRKYLQTLSSPTDDTELPDSIENAIVTEQDEIIDKIFTDTTPTEEIQPNLVVNKQEKLGNTVVRRNLPSPMGTPTRPAKSLKELVSSYQDRKEIKSHSSNFNNRSVSPKKKPIVDKKERKNVRFQHKRIWSKQHTRNAKRTVNKATVTKNLTQRKTTEIQGIPILKSVANSTHKRIINRMGTFPCRKCKRVFDRIKSLNAHMKCHSLRTIKGSIRPVQNDSQATQDC